MTDDQPSSFRYTSYQIDSTRHQVRFDFQVSLVDAEYQLSEQIIFPVPLRDSSSQAAALAALHIALGTSYYKTFLPGKIEHPYAMDQQVADFWNSVWRDGYGEFLYVNQLDQASLAKFQPQPGLEISATDQVESNPDKLLLGIGGGKDSIVGGELLKDIGLDIRGFVMATGEQLGQTQSVARTMGVDLLVVERALDPQPFELQQLPGTYRGHVPISLVFALVGMNLAIATGSRYIAVANESSASSPRIHWRHGDVNHQWSKSLEFERLFQKYTQSNIPDFDYFSAIRPLSSVAVAKLFAQLPKYFEVFTSDNYLFRIDPSRRPHGRWSLDSPKSLSSFILLAPWLDESQLERTFGRNFLDQPQLEKLFASLVGIQGQPPLDCVGTIDELVLSLNLAVSQGKFTSSHLVNYAHAHGILADVDRQADLAAALALSPDHAFPSELSDRLFTKLREGLGS